MAPSHDPAAGESEGLDQVNMKPIEGGRMYSAGDVRIIVIDDDPAIGRLVEATLAGHEFNIHVVSESHKVEPALRGMQFHVVILDYVLPGLDSSEMLKLVKDTQPDACIVVVTAFPSIDSTLQCLRAHTFDYLTKPFQVEALKKTVMRCLESRGLLRLSEEALREQLGGAIRERRKALGLTLAEMAKRTDIDASHAFYLGFELAKAFTALMLGKNYVQDQALTWGFLTVPEKNEH